jgi:hypothetical protein
MIAACTPLAAQAAAPAPVKVTKADIDRGMKEVPQVITDAGVTCTVTNARFIGMLNMPADAKVPGSKPQSVGGYEASCKEGLGYTFINTKPKVLAQDCIASAGSPVLTCALPENADPKAGLNPIVAETGRTCGVTGAKFMGATPTGTSFYEVSCQTGAGYLIQREPAKAAIAIPCIAMADTKLACTLTTLDQSKALIKTLAAGTKNTCAITDVRFVGSTNSGLDGYEVACGDTGYMFTVNSTGAVTQTVTCALAASFLGGCKLTDATKAETAEAKTYTDLAKKAGFPCDVGKYRLIGVMGGNTDVVELSCKNRPDGAVGAFNEDAAKTKVYDCVMVGMLGQECKLGGSSQPAYDKLSAALTAKGKGSCKVSGARYIGGAADGGNFIETACSDGGSGWVVKTQANGYTADTLTPCATAQGAVACKLPSNLKK